MTTKEETMKHLLMTCATIALLAMPVGAEAAKRGKPPVLEQFYAEGFFDVTGRDILRHGPLTLVLRCGDEIREGIIGALAVRSEEPGTIITTEPALTFGGPGSEDQPLLFAANGVGTEEIFSAGFVPAEPKLFTSFEGVGASATTPSGWSLTIPADLVSFGLALDEVDPLWSNAPGCFVSGIVWKFKRPSFVPTS
jgi:hypothetical protein